MPESLLDQIHAARDTAIANGQHAPAEWITKHADEPCPAAIAHALGMGEGAPTDAVKQDIELVARHPNCGTTCNLTADFDGGPYKTVACASADRVRPLVTALAEANKRTEDVPWIHYGCDHERAIATLTRQLETSKEALKRIETGGAHLMQGDGEREMLQYIEDVRRVAGDALAAIDAPAPEREREHWLIYAPCVAAPVGCTYDFNDPEMRDHNLVPQPVESCPVCRAPDDPSSSVPNAPAPKREHLCQWPLCGKPESENCHQLCYRRLDESRQREFCNDGGCHPFTPPSSGPNGQAGGEAFSAEEAREGARAHATEAARLRSGDDGTEYTERFAAEHSRTAATLRKYADMVERERKLRRYVNHWTGCPMARNNTATICDCGLAALLTPETEGK